MSRVTILLCLFLISIPLRAGWDVSGDKTYHITRDYDEGEGFIGLGAYHDSSLLLHLVSGEDLTDDGRWTIERDGDGFTFKNVKTGKYLTHVDTYQSTCKYLGFADAVTDDNQRFAFLQYDDCLVIQNIGSGYYFNLRTTTGNLFGGYATYQVASNTLFHLVDEDGGEICYTEDDTDEAWTESGDYHVFSDWTSDNHGEGDSTSKYTITFTSVAGSVLSFDWKVSSENGEDMFNASLDGERVISDVSGERSGTYSTTFPVAGCHTLVLSYSKDVSYDGGDDEAVVSGIEVVNNPFTLTVNCYDTSSGDLIHTDTYKFRTSYTLSSYPEITNYVYNSSSVTLPYTFTQSRVVEFYYDYTSASSTLKSTNVSSGAFPANAHCTG